jgi:hypothetical protein
MMRMTGRQKAEMTKKCLIDYEIEKILDYKT